MDVREEDQSYSSDEIDLERLEKQTNWDGLVLVKYGGYWCVERFFRPILASRKHFRAKNTDVILLSMPKSGTTWLKALAFSISNRHVYPIDRSPLLTTLPHKLVPFLEFDLYLHRENPNLEDIPNPRIFGTHMPFEILPHSIHGSDCRIIYICRNPLDKFISSRHFLLENRLEKDFVPLELGEAFDMFCRGIHPFGPFWDNMLGYWNAHLKNPQKVMFLTYEDLKEDISFHVKKIAEFIGCPFSSEEEEQGLVEDISRLCSFESLKNLDANKTGYFLDGSLKNSTFFRKGEVGDWRNYLTPTMVESFKKIMETKLEGSGLMFKI